MNATGLIGMRYWIVGAWVVAASGCGSEPPPPVPPPVSPPASSPASLPASSPASPQASAAVVSEAEGLPAHLQVVVLKDIEAMIAETSAEGRVLVIDFWATWCVPCVEMFPELHGGLVGLGERVRPVSVTLDDPTREGEATAFLAEHDALHDAYRFVSDSRARQALVDGLGERWNNLSVPAILVYDPRGRLAGEFLEGGTARQILDRVGELLASDREDQP